MCASVQNQREVTLAGFRSGKFPVLVATDVAARGLDISGVELVVQCEPPKDPETYIHRSGMGQLSQVNVACLNRHHVKFTYEPLQARSISTTFC